MSAICLYLVSCLFTFLKAKVTENIFFQNSSIYFVFKKSESSSDSFPDSFSDSDSDSDSDSIC